MTADRFSPIPYVRVRLQGQGQRPFVLEVVSENQIYIVGYQVNLEGERVAPRTAKFPAADWRKHIIEKTLIARLEVMRMNLTYAQLEPVE